MISQILLVLAIIFFAGLLLGPSYVANNYCKELGYDGVSGNWQYCYTVDEEGFLDWSDRQIPHTGYILFGYFEK